MTAMVSLRRPKNAIVSDINNTLIPGSVRPQLFESADRDIMYLGGGKNDYDFRAAQKKPGPWLIPRR